MLKNRLVGAVPLVLGLAIAFPATAHYIWIEQDASQHARLYFGEYQEQLKEATGGRLDAIKGPRAWQLDVRNAPREIKVGRQSNHFDLGVVNPAASILSEETGYAVMDLTKYGYGVVKPMFYARFSPLPVRPEGRPGLALDVLPEADSPDGVTVYFRNAPLADAKVMVYAPNQWMQEHRADQNGKVKISTPWPGYYVLEVVHLEKQPGEFLGQKFEAIRHRATLSFETKAKADARQ